MDASRQLITAWSYGLAGFVYAILAIYLASGWRNGSRGRALFVAVALCALWGMTGLAVALTGARVLLAVSQLTDVLRFGGWSLFLLLLLKPDSSPAQERPWRYHWLVACALLLVTLGVAVQLMVVLGVNLAMSLQRLGLFNSLAMAVLVLVLLELLFRTVSRDSRWTIKPLCIGLGGAVVFDLYLYSDALLFNVIDIDAFSIRGFVHALVVPLVTISSVRNHNWKKGIVLSQRAALQSVALVAVGAYLMFMAAAGYYVRFFGGEWGRAVQIALLFAALLLLGVLSASGVMRAKFKVIVGKNFFRYRYDYREEWLRFTDTLSSLNGTSVMGQRVINGLADMVESPAGAIWLKDPAGRFYTQTACWNMPALTAIEAVDSDLCRFMLESGWVINFEEYRSHPRRYDGLRLPDWLLVTPNAWLVVPLVTGSEMIGFVVLATARTHMDIDWEVNDLLKTAGRQAAAFLGQVQASEALLEARKFEAFNRMSAFVVHDLKNVVAQLSLLLKNAERHRDKPEFQSDMLATVENSVDRMRHLMLQLHEGSTPVDNPRGIDVGEIIRRIQTAKAAQGRLVGVELRDRVIAKGHEDRVERVIGHIVQNALDATEDGGEVKIRLERQDDHAAIWVRDTGRGMSPEFVRERLFKPFQTTKVAGMGIGAYESFQYVNELGGKLVVDSELDVGTEVCLLLPSMETLGRSGKSIRTKES